MDRRKCKQRWSTKASSNYEVDEKRKGRRMAQRKSRRDGGEEKGQKRKKCDVGLGEKMQRKRSRAEREEKKGHEKEMCWGKRKGAEKEM